MHQMLQISKLRHGRCFSEGLNNWVTGFSVLIDITLKLSGRILKERSNGDVHEDVRVL